MFKLFTIKQNIKTIKTKTHTPSLKVLPFFFAVDQVENVRLIRLHVGNLEVEPLKMVVRVAVRVHHQIVLIISFLKNSI